MSDDDATEVAIEIEPRPVQSGGSGPTTSSPSSMPPPAASRPASGSGRPPTMAETTQDAMHAEEAARAASFRRGAAILCAIGLVCQLGYAGNPRLRIATAVAQVVLGGVGVWVWRRARDPARWSRSVFRVFGITASVAAVVFIQYLGVFSPALAVVVFGLSFFGLGEDGKVLVPITILVVAAYFVSAALITFDVIPDLGLFAARTAPRTARVAMFSIMTVTMLLQLWQARLGRRAKVDAIERSNAAVRVARAREAQLHEAKENLDAAIRAGAGRSGRYTGTQAGRFRLENIVGRGAMGEVYAACGEPDNDRAAVKLLHIRGLEEPDLIGRFLREAEVARRVRGPNLVDVLEVGNTEDGSPYIAMELLEGRDLATLLRDRPCLTLAESVTLVDDVARGLAVLHKAGVIHRDLKPANLFLSQGPPPCWKILDFGVSKLRESTMTEQQVVGTPGYMSPEQAEGGIVDGRSDLFALGAVAYRVLTGQRPFTGYSTPELLYQVVFAQPVRPREVQSAIPRDVELVLAIALAKAPKGRFPTATAFAVAMRAAARGELSEKMRGHAERILRAAPWATGAA